MPVRLNPYLSETTPALKIGVVAFVAMGLLGVFPMAYEAEGVV